jgi:hypothetical protein
MPTAVNIFDLVTPNNIVSYWDDFKASQDNYMGETLFPSTKQLGIELNKIGGRAGLPVELKASAFDTQATYRDRLSIEMSKQKMPFYREGMTIDEETRQELVKLSQSGNQSILVPLVNKIFDDTNNLLRGARVARERMAMELISTGHITIAGTGVKLNYNYGLDTKHQFTAPAVLWSDTDNAKPLQDMQAWKDAFGTRYGINLTFAVMTTATFNLIVNNKYIVKQLNTNLADPTGIFVSRAAVKNVVASTVGVQILINDNIYATKVGGASKKFFPDGTVTFLPANGVLGNMVFGSTPEELDLMMNTQFAGATKIADVGVAVTSILIPHPVNKDTIVSQICLPSFGSDVESGAGSILISKVA